MGSRIQVARSEGPIDGDPSSSSDDEVAQQVGRILRQLWSVQFVRENGLWTKEAAMPGKADTPDDLEALRSVVTALEPFDAPDRERIVRWACEKLGIAVASGTRAPGAEPQLPTLPSTPLPSPVQASGKRDLRTFITEKAPASDTHFATAVAYYYQFEAPESERRNAITAADLTEACRLADRTRLQNPGQTLRNALADGLLDRAEPGTFKINAVGENLVAMALPAGGSTRRAKSAAKPRRRPARKGTKRARGVSSRKASKGTTNRTKRR